MSKRMPWFRMYVDFLNDPKMITLAFEDQRHFIGLLALKSDGVLDQDCEPALLDRIVAQRLWIDYAIIRDVKKRLYDAGLIDVDWQPLAWEKRQFRSDRDPTGAERQRRYRENKKNDGSNALRNATVTLPDTDTDTDTEAEKKKATRSRSRALPRPEGVNDQTWLDWLALRKAKKAPVTETVLKQARREAGKAGMSLDDFLQIWCARGSQGLQADWLKPSEINGAKKPTHSAAADFRGKTYAGTPINKLPASLRAAMQD